MRTEEQISSAKARKAAPTRRRVSHARPSRGIIGVLMAALALTAVLGIGGTFAYLTVETAPVENVLKSSSVSSDVVEEFNGAEKRNVAIKNTGDVDAYLRAAVVVTWQDASGNVYGQAPVKGADYKIEYGTVWYLALDGFYYYPNRVPVGMCSGQAVAADTPDYLITECTPVSGKAPEGYALHVEIISSAVQADGNTGGSTPVAAVVNAWDNDKIDISVDGDESLIIKAQA